MSEGKRDISRMANFKKETLMGQNNLTPSKAKGNSNRVNKNVFLTRLLWSPYISPQTVWDAIDIYIEKKKKKPLDVWTTGVELLPR